MPKDGVEDEPHFLFKCKNFENIRKPYLETIYTLCPNLKTCNNENICIWIIIVYKSILNHCMNLTFKIKYIMYNVQDYSLHYDTVIHLLICEA
jgi:hypothetical protein